MQVCLVLRSLFFIFLCRTRGALATWPFRGTVLFVLQPTGFLYCCSEFHFVEIGRVVLGDCYVPYFKLGAFVSAPLDAVRSSSRQRQNKARVSKEGIKVERLKKA